MEDVGYSYGIAIAKNDRKLQEALQKNENIDQEIIHQYITLKDFSTKCSDKFKDEVINLLQERNLYLQNKLPNKENQNRALLVVLEYLNSLDRSETKSHMKEILANVSLLDREIITLQKII